MPGGRQATAAVNGAASAGRRRHAAGVTPTAATAGVSTDPGCMDTTTVAIRCISLLRPHTSETGLWCKRLWPESPWNPVA